MLQDLRARGEWTQLGTPAAHFSAGVYQAAVQRDRPGHQRALLSVSVVGIRAAPPLHARISRAHGRMGPLSRAGRRALVVDAWESRPAEEGAGAVISGWQIEQPLHAPQLVGARASSNQQLARRFGRPPLIEEVYGRPSARSLIRLRRELLTAPGRLADAVTELLRHESFDLAWLRPSVGAHSGAPAV